MIWREVTDAQPADHVTVMLHRKGDLYPVIGSRMTSIDKTLWMLEEGGAEDDLRRNYPLLWWTPTHWSVIRGLP